MTDMRKPKVEYRINAVTGYNPVTKQYVGQDRVYLEVPVSSVQIARLQLDVVTAERLANEILKEIAKHS